MKESKAVEEQVTNEHIQVFKEDSQPPTKIKIDEFNIVEELTTLLLNRERIEIVVGDNCEVHHGTICYQLLLQMLL